MRWFIMKDMVQKNQLKSQTMLIGMLVGFYMLVTGPIPCTLFTSLVFITLEQKKKHKAKKYYLNID
jgi:hypothetical protein